jgi:predicted Zn-dependent protease
MTHLPGSNPRLPDDINNSHTSPLADFAFMAAGLLLLIVGLSLAIGWSATWLGPHIPLSWEPQIVIGKTEEKSDHHQKIERYLQNLTTSLASETGKSAIPVTLHYLPDVDLPNAFATSGQNIHVTAGLLNKVSSENALAMILAHEYAHIEYRHPAILMLEQLAHTLLFAMLGLNEDGAGAIAGNTGLATLMSFSRKMEHASDIRALELLLLRYGHTQGAAEFFNAMMLEEDYEETGGVLSLFASHPDTNERLQRIAGYSNDGKLTPLPDWLTSATEE